MLYSALLYFAAVFGAGFVLGPIRVLYLVPRLGERWAELLEMPVMWTVIVLAARWVVQRRRRRQRMAAGEAAVVGAVAFVMLLAAEFGFVLWLRGISIGEYLATRDPMSGAVYYASLVGFAMMPWWFARRRER
ncbi:hypothetical protein F183_A38700 [Bryobacterales bacterium F-183]|nr:hypothetical protein F183_A38700 [Bryobacterales bacterium F-183]